MSEETRRVAYVELSHPAAIFLRGMVECMNQRKLLPDDNQAALETSAWLEEIEAAVRQALRDERGLAR